MSVNFICECGSSCTLRSNISKEHIQQYLALFSDPLNQIDFIVDGCQRGPLPGAILLEEGDGYTLYQNQEEN